MDQIAPPFTFIKPIQEPNPPVTNATETFGKFVMLKPQIQQRPHGYNSRVEHPSHYEIESKEVLRDMVVNCIKDINHQKSRMRYMQNAYNDRCIHLAHNLDTLRNEYERTLYDYTMLKWQTREVNDCIKISDAIISAYNARDYAIEEQGRKIQYAQEEALDADIKAYENELKRTFDDCFDIEQTSAKRAKNK
jgi:hypothetical protein